MCGFVGIAKGDISSKYSENIKRMCGAISHRGPDSEGYYENDHVALGFRRLSIIDLESGDQPIHNEKNDIWSVFNGEIYNYKEIRQELIAKGHKLYTSSDSEVMVHLYEEYGISFVDKLRGMFAICVYDSIKKKVILVRDRLGIKPLLYAELDKNLIFGSELKGLLESGLLNQQIDEESLSDFLYLQYVPFDQCIYKQVNKLQPGELLQYDLDSKSSSIKKYWDLNEIDPTCTNQKLDYEVVLRDSVKLLMRSDVPVGAFLSGGLDSSMIVALMSEISEQKINTFSVEFTESAWDESQYSRHVAQKFNTQHHAIVLTPDDLLTNIDSVLGMYDEPFADASAIPTYAVSNLASQHVKVVLSGDGSDETLGGYKRYSSILSYNKFNFLREITGAKLGSHLASYTKFNHSLFNKGLKFCSNVFSSDFDRHMFYLSYFRRQKNLLFQQQHRSRFKEYDAGLNDYYNSIKKEGLSKALYFETNTYLPGDILYKVDIASMANSLEVRVPFLDHVMVEKAFSLEVNELIQGSSRKHVLRQMATQYFDDGFINRKKKGFEIPVSEWLKAPLHEKVRSSILDSALIKNGLFDTNYIEQMLSQHKAGDADHGSPLWVLFSLAMWHHNYGGSIN